MDVSVGKSATLSDYLAWENRQEAKHEFDGVRIVAVEDITVRHSTFRTNLLVAVHSRLRGKSCKCIGSSFKFLTARSTVRYPAGMVVCTHLDPDATFTETPTVVFETESSRTTRIDKADEYQTTPSVMRYVMLEQDSIGAVVYSRVSGAWTHILLRDGATLAMPEIDVEFPLAELYEGISFEDPEAEPA